MVEIPPEIWMYIASYLPDNTLRNLYSVNSAFFETSMNNRWRDITLESRNLPVGLKIFNRILDPFVAARIRKLTVHCSRLGESSIRATVDPHIRFTRDSLAFLRKTVRSTIQRDPFDEFMDNVMALNPKLGNVCNLHLSTSELSPKYDLRPLCSMFWASFGANLSVLTLIGNVEHYRAIMETSPSLPLLSELRLEFKGNIFQFREDSNDPGLHEEDAMVMRTLASFVNKLRPHLEGLRICSWAADLDTSPFFAGLAMFPKLQYFGVRVPLEKALRKPSILKHVLWRHGATLKRIELRLHPSRSSLNWHDDDTEDFLYFWLTDCLVDERCFSQVNSLDMYPTASPEGITIVVATLERIANTIVRLIFRDRYFQHEDVLMLIEAASKCLHLKYLRINVFGLNIGLMDCMAERLPNLQGLCLSIGDHFLPDDVTTLRLEFTEALKSRCYDKWRLRDLAVWQRGSEVHIDAMHTLAASIPSLESLFEGKIYI